MSRTICMSRTAPAHYGCKILAVGSGTGMVDKRLLNLIEEELRVCKWPKITYTVVEVDPEAVEMCKKTLSTIGLDIEFKWEVMTVNQYFSQPPEQFDMIHFMYSLFVMDKPLDGVVDLLKRNYLAKDGVFFTMYNDSKEEFFGDIMFENMDSIMKVFEGGDAFDARQSVSGTEEEPCQTLDDNALSKQVVELGWSCKDFSKYNKEYVTDILDRTEAGIERLGYILGCSDLKRKMPGEDLEKILQQIDKKAKKEVVDGKEIRFGESLHHMIMIYHA